MALAVADEVWMLENAIYSVISPEGCTSILWGDRSKASEASECLKLTASDLLDLKIIEEIIPENDALVDELRLRLAVALQKYSDMPPAALTGRRYDRFRVL